MPVYFDEAVITLPPVCLCITLSYNITSCVPVYFDEAVITLPPVCLCITLSYNITSCVSVYFDEAVIPRGAVLVLKLSRTILGVVSLPARRRFSQTFDVSLTLLVLLNTATLVTPYRVYNRNRVVCLILCVGCSI